MKKAHWICLTLSSSISSLVGQNFMRLSTWSTSNAESSKARTEHCIASKYYQNKKEIFIIIKRGCYWTPAPILIIAKLKLSIDNQSLPLLTILEGHHIMQETKWTIESKNMIQTFRSWPLIMLGNHNAWIEDW